ncbi:bifunctional tetrahydrofolate synthase/dihydrofolate synthase [Chitinimonas koreensis]|uniref:bifunctional tetrahydrofolate synthase/dihydrofolate synthase n=1 Tax=Chitinimonas koreensis TaxID=356302 RepID=UPI000409ED43|nr:bifunctional tetrahydrofolate synthase/dihydrofolate synthase [Chitinimonas koreensis]QNM94970.1 bifunctional tetrahydrofolate synthase/dihydrofolate synthase [Chitinimonas koreensis]
MSFDADSLAAWLAHLEQLHPSAIDMGLERVARVRDAMGLAPDFPVVVVGGTNGKGSTCAMLSAAYRAAGFKVGTYTSPHILHYNERVAIDLLPADDAAIVAGFRAVEAARGDTSLTYFEFGTLAAMHQFIAAGVEVAVLEVGLGGRLDAVNVFEPDVAAVVSVDIDHQAFLGDDRESIGFEKAGIFRPGKPAFCADPNPPRALVEQAERIGAELQLIGRDFGYVNETTQWRWRGRNGQKPGLPFPALRGAYQLGNASLVIAILDALYARLPVGIGDLKRGLLEVELPGRYQVLPGRPSIVLDVAHNPHAAAALAQNLLNQGFFQATHAVFGMMADKDIAGVVACLKDRIEVWHVATLDTPRAATAEALARAIVAAGAQGRVQIHGSIAEAFAAARSAAGENDRIAAFGSFYTVAGVLALGPR